MGVHERARVGNEKLIVELTAEKERLEALIAKNRIEKSNLDREIVKLGIAEVQGDRSALRKQGEFAARMEECSRKISNLEAAVAPIRQALAAAEAAIPRFLLFERHEQLGERIAELSGMTAALSKIVAPVAHELGAYGARFTEDTEEVFALLAGGDPERIVGLRNRFRVLLVRAIRAQLSFEFRSVGLDIVVSPEFEGRDFQAVIEPELRKLMEALEIGLHDDGVPTLGRETFRFLTNVRGLFGISFFVGATASLPVADVEVQKLLASGAVEIVKPTASRMEVGA